MVENMIVTKCKTCGRVILSFPSQIKLGQGKFCSLKCRGLGHTKRFEKKCEFCEKKFITYPFRVKKGNGRFCSVACNNKFFRGENHCRWGGGKVERMCSECGKRFEADRWIVNGGGAKYCSKLCSSVGQNNPAWKGGKVKRLCQLCGKEFDIIPARLKQKGGGRFCSNSCRSVNTVSKGKKKDTGIERKIEAELLKRGISFEKQYPVYQAHTVPDFFIKPNICIYADGDYWHNRPEVKERDKDKNFGLNFLGYKVHRFWEHEIKKDVAKCVDSIGRA